MTKLCGGGGGDGGGGGGGGGGENGSAISTQRTVSATVCRALGVVEGDDGSDDGES